MSSFTGPLNVIELDKNWRQWQLGQDLVYEVDFEGSGRAIVAPAGFITDGTTIPRFLWWLIPTWGKYSRASVIHDYVCDLYVRHMPHIEAKTIKKCDAIFLEAMKVLKVSWLIRNAMWLTVRIASILYLRQSSWIEN